MLKFVTPPQVAKERGIATKKVIDWIQSGELPATNLAQRLDGDRPRYKISIADLEAFERRRAVVPAVQAAPRRRRQDAAVKNFF